MDVGVAKDTVVSFTPVFVGQPYTIVSLVFKHMLFIISIFPVDEAVPHSTFSWL